MVADTGRWSMWGLSVRTGTFVLIVATLLTCTPDDLRASEVRRITFREAVEIALAQNTALQRAENQTALDRPIILLTHDSHNKKITPEEIDLGHEPDIEIRSKGL